MTDELKILVCDDGAVLVDRAGGEWVRESMPGGVDPRSPYRAYREMFRRKMIREELEQADGDSR